MSRGAEAAPPGQVAGSGPGGAGAAIAIAAAIAVPRGLGGGCSLQ